MAWHVGLRNKGSSKFELNRISLYDIHWKHYFRELSKNSFLHFQTGLGLPNEMVTQKKGAKNKNRSGKKSKPANGHVRNHTIEENGNHLDIPEPTNFKVIFLNVLIKQ